MAILICEVVRSDKLSMAFKSLSLFDVGQRDLQFQFTNL